MSRGHTKSQSEAVLLVTLGPVKVMHTKCKDRRTEVRPFAEQGPPGCLGPACTDSRGRRRQRRGTEEGDERVEW